MTKRYYLTFGYINEIWELVYRPVILHTQKGIYNEFFVTSMTTSLNADGIPDVRIAGFFIKDERRQTYFYSDPSIYITEKMQSVTIEGEEYV